MKRYLPLVFLLLIPVTSSSGDTVDWDEATSGSATVVGMLDGIQIELTNTSSDGNPTIKSGFGAGTYGGDAGIFGGLFPAGVEQVQHTEAGAGNTYTYVFSQATTENWFYHYTGGDNSDWTYNTGMDLVSQIGGTWDGTTLDHDGSNGTQGGGGSFKIAAGSTGFTMTRAGNGGDAWWSTFQAVPEPGSAVVLLGFGTFLGLVRRRK